MLLRVARRRLRRTRGTPWSLTGVRARRLVATCYKRQVSFWRAALHAVRGFVTGVVALVGAATLLGLLDRVWWVFETADVFRLQYLFALLAAALTALVLRRPRLAVLAALFAAVNVSLLGIPLTPEVQAAPTPSGAGALRILVANVEVGNTDFAAVERLVAQTNPDLFGVTELTPAMARQLGKSLTGYRTHVVAARDDAYGIGVYSRVPIESAEIMRLPADGPPTAVVRLRDAGRTLTVVVTHVHTPFAGSIHVRQLEALATVRPQLGKRVAVCGDFNTPPWSGPLRRFAGDAGLHDVYGSRAWAAYSWPTWGYVLRLPIDNCFVSSGVDVTAHHDGPDVGSDHRPLVVDLGVE
jgi:endonuclease/exonuclease/phosphatase (EEP) superfamily protein YafD